MVMSGQSPPILVDFGFFTMLFFHAYTQGEGNDQRTNGPVNAHLISWPSKAQNIQNLENIW